ncbi:hypothetical protein [Rhodococcus erythropolis]
MGRPLQALLIERSQRQIDGQVLGVVTSLRTVMVRLLQLDVVDGVLAGVR